jgi:uncharacterized protein (TIGR04255 family)
VHFTQDTLEQVICQLRFPTILAIGTAPPAEFQNRVRHKYPLYQRTGDQPPLPAELGPVLAQLGMPSPPFLVGHQFNTEDSACTISLTQDFVAIAHLHYDRWENFLPEIDLAESALREVYQPAFYTRVGLRYRDIVNRVSIGIKQEDWSNLIQPYFAGLLATETATSVLQSTSATRLRIDAVEGATVTIRHGLTEIESRPDPCYVIDADFAAEGKCDRDGAFRALDIFHHLAGNLFRWAITPRLYEALGPEPLD